MGLSVKRHGRNVFLSQNPKWTLQLSVLGRLWVVATCKSQSFSSSIPLDKGSLKANVVHRYSWCRFNQRLEDTLHRSLWTTTA
ncbi:hypothetical protein GBA52_022310 [Prunus armeniaca]|nr:hypothetical protein GBA52_022310 [Prunus armeniaca]